MKQFCPSTTNIYENYSPFIYKNISEINTNSNSPIRVRKKRSNIIKVNSLESFKLFKLSDQTQKYKLKNNPIKINLNIFITNNLIRYNSYPYFFYIKVTNQILFNLPNRLVSVFKDYLIWDGNYDYLKVFYNLKKSVELLPKLGNYYQTYTLFTPVYFPLTDLNDIISKYIKNKKKYLEITQEDNDEIKEEKEDLDKNITETKHIKKENDDNSKNSKNNNDGELNNKNKKKLPNESDNKNNEKKLINTTEIKTENSGSLSNYFGIDSIIKSKENSNYGVNNNFENQLINYSLLEQIKTKYKNKKDKDKVNLDYSLELAAIIQSFEEKEKDYYNKRKQKTNSCNTKKIKNLSTNKSLVNVNNSKTNDYFFKTRSKANSKTKKSINHSVKGKRKIINQKLNKKSNSLVSIKFKKENIKTILENYKQSYHNLNRITTNNAFYYENYLTLNVEKPHLLNKNDNDIIIKDNNMTIFNTNNILHKNSKKPLNPKAKNKNNLESQTLKYKKIIKKQSKSMMYTIIKNDNNNNQNLDDKNTFKMRKRKNNCISLNLNKFNSDKTNEYYYKISTTPTSKLNNIIRNNSRNKNNNIYNSQSHSHRTEVKSLNLTPKKIIFVNKKLRANSIKDKKYTEQNTNRISASTNNFNTLNSNKNSNIIIVNKKDFLTKSGKKENHINTEKYSNISNELDTNCLDGKNNLNQYKSFIRTDYNTFIPKIIMKKMILNKLKTEKIIINKKLNSKYLSIKKHNISSKKHLNTCYTTNINNTRTNTLFKDKKKNININIDKHFVNSKDKKFNKNKKALSEINNLIKINLKNERPSHIKNKNISIFSVYEKENSPSYKNKSNKNNKFNKALNEINNLKRSHCKSFINKNNLLINVNIYNNFKINSESNDDQIKLKERRTTMNGKLRPSQINKNKIHNLIIKTTNDDINKYDKKPYKLIYGKQSSNNNTYISENITDFSKREKTKLIKLK